MQNTSNLLMIKPINFGFNQETAVNNAFQVAGLEQQVAQQNAEKEFDNFVEKLNMNGIDITIVKDTPTPYTPDSIFPNNWISFHKGNKICLYPMFAENRRKERKPNVIDTIKQKFIINETIDFTHFENENKFLEGTGSMVLDRENNIAYACLSQRTDKKVFEEFCSKMNFKGISFTALDNSGGEIYHTNVMMCVADKYAVVCLDSIKDTTERKLVADSLINSGKEIVEITTQQMNNFAGNMLQVKNNSGVLFLIMSTRALKSLSTGQINKIKFYNAIIDS